jgi:hypothetical protein
VPPTSEVERPPAVAAPRRGLADDPDPALLAVTPAMVLATVEQVLAR